MNSRNLICLTFAVFLVGCASAKQYVPLPDQSVRIEDKTKGRIYVIRPAGSMAGMIPMAVADNGVLIGDTGPRTYLCWEREPGDVKVTSKSENTSWVKFTVEPDQVYYIQQNMKIGFAIARNKIELVDEEQAQKHLKNCSPPKVKLRE